MYPVGKASTNESWHHQAPPPPSSSQWSFSPRQTTPPRAEGRSPSSTSGPTTMSSPMSCAFSVDSSAGVSAAMAAAAAPDATRGYRTITSSASSPAPAPAPAAPQAQAPMASAAVAQQPYSSGAVASATTTATVTAAATAVAAASAAATSQQYSTTSPRYTTTSPQHTKIPLQYTSTPQLYTTTVAGLDPWQRTPSVSSSSLSPPSPSPSPSVCAPHLRMHVKSVTRNMGAGAASSKEPHNDNTNTGRDARGCLPAESNAAGGIAGGEAGDMAGGEIVGVTGETAGVGIAGSTAASLAETSAEGTAGGVSGCRGSGSGSGGIGTHQVAVDAYLAAGANEKLTSMEDILATAWRTREFGSPKLGAPGREQSLLLSRALEHPSELPSAMPSWCCTTTGADATETGLEECAMGGASSDTWSVGRSKDGSIVGDSLDKDTRDRVKSPAESRHVDAGVSTSCSSSVPLPSSNDVCGGTLRTDDNHRRSSSSSSPDSSSLSPPSYSSPHLTPSSSPHIPPSSSSTPTSSCSPALGVAPAARTTTTTTTTNNVTATATSANTNATQGSFETSSGGASRLPLSHDPPPPIDCGLSISEWNTLSPSVRAGVAKQSAEVAALRLLGTNPTAATAADRCCSRSGSQEGGRVFDATAMQGSAAGGSGGGGGGGGASGGGGGGGGGGGSSGGGSAQSLLGAPLKTFPGRMPGRAGLAVVRISRAQQEERLKQIKNNNAVLEHTVTCQDHRCRTVKCDKMKALLAHHASCAIGGAKERCDLCRRISALIQIHARDCRKDGCLVPYCVRLRRRILALNNERREAAMSGQKRSASSGWEHGRQGGTSS